MPDTPDLARTLEQLAARGATDYAAQVLALYQRVMRVYEPAQRNYRSVLDANAAHIEFSSSTNG